MKRVCKSHDRTLIDFRPLTISTDSTTPLTYNITIMEGGAADNSTSTFSKSFFTIGEKAQEPGVRSMVVDKECLA